MISRRQLLTLSALSGAAVLAGCGSTTASGPASSAGTSPTHTPTPTPTPTPSRSGSPSSSARPLVPASELIWWTHHPAGASTAEAALVTLYNSSQTATRVTLASPASTAGGLVTHYMSSAPSARPQLLTVGDTNWYQLRLQHLIAPLNGMLARFHRTPDGLYPTLLQTFADETDQWALPYAMSTPLLYYNKDAFAAAGLNGFAPHLWTETQAWSGRLLEAMPVLRYAYLHPAPGQDSLVVQSQVWGWGANLSVEWAITCRGASVVTAMQWMQNSVLDGWAGIATSDPILDFRRGLAAMTVAASAALPRILARASFDLGVAPLPVGPDASGSIVPVAGFGLAMASQLTPSQQLAAANFMAFVTSAENSALFANQSSYLPVSKSANVTAGLRTLPQLQVAIDQVPHARPQDWARARLPGGAALIAKAASDILAGAATAPRLTTLESSLTSIYLSQVKPRLS